MNDRRLAGIDLGIASVHTVRVLDGEGNMVAKRKAWPTVESLTEVEAAALAGCPSASVLEVVVDPTGPAWLPMFRPAGWLAERTTPRGPWRPAALSGTRSGRVALLARALLPGLPRQGNRQQ